MKTPAEIMAQRKAEHIALALKQQRQLETSDFDNVRFVHHSFAPLRIEDVQLETKWANQQHAWPFYINAMTGGSSLTRQYNEQLAIIARETGLALASGSVSAAMSQPDVADSYAIMRQVNPQGFIIANLGAHHGLENAKRAMELMQADALQIHLNVPQEVVMPEGDRDFTTWLANIETIVRELDVPVIVKEVGFGMSCETLQQLAAIGVQTVDVSGRGGTNFIQIEDERNAMQDFRGLYQYGQTTVEALLEAQTASGGLTILASGGIRQPVDIIKALALGAHAVGIAGHFLATLKAQGVDTTIQLVKQWQTELRQLYLLLGAHDLSALQQTDIVLTGTVREWAQDRQLPYQALATRRRQSANI